jgi:predicted MFS family arabinose efflux permease
MGSTVQGLLVGFYSGLGQGTGTVLGGFINKALGARMLFSIVSIMCLVALIIFVCSNTYFYYAGSHFGSLKLPDTAR